MSELPPNNEEQQENLPLYLQSEVVERAETDERLARHLRALELADQGRQVSESLHKEMELATQDHLRANYPELFPETPPTDSEI